MTTFSVPDSTLHKLAAEIALQYHSPVELAAQHEIPPTYLSKLLDDPRFQAMVASARREIDETGDQIRLVARRLLADVVPKIALIAADDNVSPRDRVDAFRALLTVAGADKQKNEGGQAFMVQINL